MEDGAEAECGSSRFKEGCQQDGKGADRAATEEDDNMDRQIIYRITVYPDKTVQAHGPAQERVI